MEGVAGWSLLGEDSMECNEMVSGFITDLPKELNYYIRSR